MFKITGGKGFHITFDNGWTVSVQFGAGNYGDNYNLCDYSRPTKDLESTRAEVWCWDKDDNKADDIEGYSTAAQVLEYINKVAAK